MATEFEIFLDERRHDVHTLALRVVTGVLRNPCDEKVFQLVSDGKSVSWSAKWGQKVSHEDSRLLPIAQSIACDAGARNYFSIMLEGFKAMSSTAASRE